MSEYKSPLIVGLEIDEFDLESGVDMIALVENPAIEANFVYFQKQLKDIQQKETFTDEEIFELILEDYFSGKYIEDLPQDIQDKLFQHLSSVGESEDDLLNDGWSVKSIKEDIRNEKDLYSINSTTDKESMLDTGAVKIRYKYVGPKDNKNRNFCASMMNTPNKVYRLEDINKATIQGANNEFGVYDIFTYRGSYNCRHTWSQITYEKNLQTGELNESETIAPDQRPVVNVTTNVNPNTNATITFSAQEGDKQLIAGPLMIPNKLIYRYDDFNGEYWVYFSEDTIEKIAYKYLINKKQDMTNLEHSEEVMLKDVVLVESWIITNPDNDKSFDLTGEKYAKGTWFGVFKVLDKSIWEEYVKSGKVLGFSVEGFFSDKLINMAKKTKFYYRTTQGGTEIVIDEKTFVVFILEDGKRTAIMPDGEYELDNGKTLVVIDSKAKEGSF